MKGTLEKWEEPLKWDIDELAEPLLIKKGKNRYMSRGYYNDAIKRAVKIGWMAGVRYHKGMDEAERLIIEQRKKSD